MIEKLIEKLKALPNIHNVEINKSEDSEAMCEIIVYATVKKRMLDFTTINVPGALYFKVNLEFLKSEEDIDRMFNNLVLLLKAAGLDIKDQGGN